MLASVGREPDDVHPRVRRARTGVRRDGRRAGPAFGRADRRRRPDQRRGDRKRSAALVHHPEAPLTPRVVVDFADTDVAAEQRELEIGDGTLRRAAVAQAGSRTARVVIELVADAEFDIRSDGNTVEVRVPRPAALAAGAAPQTGPVPQAGSEAEAQKVASLPKVSLVGSKPAVPPDSEDPVGEQQPSAAEKAAALKKAL